MITWHLDHLEKVETGELEAFLVEVGADPSLYLSEVNIQEVSWIVGIPGGLVFLCTLPEHSLTQLNKC